MFSSTHCIVKLNMVRVKPASSGTGIPFSKVLNWAYKIHLDEETVICIFVLLLPFLLQVSSSIIPTTLQSRQLLHGSSSPTTFLVYTQWLLRAFKPQLHKLVQGWDDPTADLTLAC